MGAAPVANRRNRMKEKLARPKAIQFQADFENDEVMILTDTGHLYRGKMEYTRDKTIVPRPTYLFGMIEVDHGWIDPAYDEDEYNG